MKKWNVYIILITLSFSCQTNNLSEEADEIFEPSFIVDSNVVELSTRVTMSNSPAFEGQSETGIFSYVKIAEVAPNTSNGNRLSATGIAYLNNRVYVTYHVRGEQYGGEILTFDVSNPETPVLLSSLVDTSADFNDIMMGQHQGNIWVAGARNPAISNYESTDGAIATKIGLNSDKTPKNTPAWEIPLLSYSASSITRVDPPSGASNGRIFITSGSRGGLEVVRGNDSSQVFHSREAENAKHFDYYDSQGVFLRGIDQNSSAIDIYALDDSFTYQTYTIPYDVTYLGKNGIDVTAGYVYLAMGDDGVFKVNISNGQIVANFKSQGNGFANSVHVEDGLVYVANGSDGLIVLNESDLSFITSYNANGSCNYLEVKDDLLFVAYGNTGGLTILKKELGT